MKCATIAVKLEIYYEGEGEGFSVDDPKAVWLMLPDCDLFELTGECGDNIKAHIWVSGGWLYKARIEVVEKEAV